MFLPILAVASLYCLFTGSIGIGILLACVVAFVQWTFE